MVNFIYFIFLFISFLVGDLGLEISVISHDTVMVILLHNHIYFYFLNQQFITQHTKADCGSYLRSTQTKYETKRKKRREMRKIRELIKRKADKKKEKNI